MARDGAVEMCAKRLHLGVAANEHTARQTIQGIREQRLLPLRSSGCGRKPRERIPHLPGASRSILGSLGE